MRLITEWEAFHRRELESNWEKMKAGRPLDRIRIRLTFNDDQQKTIDFREWLDGPVFERRKDANYFSKFVLDGGTVAWPNDADIAPETLYAHQGVAKEAA